MVFPGGGSFPGFAGNILSASDDDDEHEFVCDEELFFSSNPRFWKSGSFPPCIARAFQTIQSDQGCCMWRHDIVGEDKKPRHYTFLMSSMDDEDRWNKVHHD